MTCLVHQRLHQEAAVASVDQDAVPDAAVRRNFPAWSPALVRGYHQSALAVVELVAHPALPPRVADQSAGPARAVRAVAVAKVVGRPAPHPIQALQVAAHRLKAQLGGAKVHQVEALPGVVPQAQCSSVSPAQQVSQRAPPVSPPARAPGWQRQVE